jgi:hypothetical protein
MEMQVDAVYENGVLRPLQPLGLAEHVHVSLTVIKAASALGSPPIDIAYLDNSRKNCCMSGRHLE